MVQRRFLRADQGDKLRAGLAQLTAGLPLTGHGSQHELKTTMVSAQDHPLRTQAQPRRTGELRQRPLIHVRRAFGSPSSHRR